MRWGRLIVVSCLGVLPVGASAQEPAFAPAPGSQPDPIIKSLVDRLDERLLEGIPHLARRLVADDQRQR